MLGALRAWGGARRPGASRHLFVHQKKASNTHQPPQLDTRLPPHLRDVLRGALRSRNIPTMSASDDLLIVDGVPSSATHASFRKSGTCAVTERSNELVVAMGYKPYMQTGTPKDRKQ